MSDTARTANPRAYPGPKAPSKLWYWIAGGLLLLSAGLVIYLVLWTALSVAQFEVEPISDSEVVTIEEGPIAVWSTDATAQCSSENLDRSNSPSSRAPIGSVSFGAKSKTWFKIIGIDGEPRSRHQVECTSAPGTELAISNEPDIIAGLARTTIVIAISASMFVTAVIIAPIVFFLRRRAKLENDRIAQSSGQYPITSAQAANPKPSVHTDQAPKRQP